MDAFGLFGGLVFFGFMFAFFPRVGFSILLWVVLTNLFNLNIALVGSHTPKNLLEIIAILFFFIAIFTGILYDASYFKEAVRHWKI